MIEWIYTTNKVNTARYTLGKKGNRNLICIGINPSTAEPENLDNTLKKVESIALQKGYDGWLMLNLYPQRDTYPENIHRLEDVEIVKSNNAAIGKMLREGDYSDVWAAWGVTIEQRSYFSNCLMELNKNFDDSFNWLHFGAVTKKGHPRHPSRVGYKEEFSSFDIDEYIVSLNK
jgi:hypothetical protein